MWMLGQMLVCCTCLENRTGVKAGEGSIPSASATELEADTVGCASLLNLSGVKAGMGSNPFYSANFRLISLPEEFDFHTVEK